MKLYKFTEQDETTYEHSTKWGEGVTHTKRVDTLEELQNKRSSGVR